MFMEEVKKKFLRDVESGTDRKICKQHAIHWLTTGAEADRGVQRNVLCIYHFNYQYFSSLFLANENPPAGVMFPFDVNQAQHKGSVCVRKSSSSHCVTLHPCRYESSRIKDMSA